jgi:hypothetical protein
MTKTNFPQAVAAFAAAVTTLVLFSSVVSLADVDRAALATGQSVKHAAVASNAGR